MTLTIERRSDPNPLNASGIALVFPKMAGRAVGCVAMLVKQDDASKPFLAPAGWQAGEYLWLSGPVRNDGQDLIVPLEESVTRLVGRSAHLRIVLLDAGIEGVTAASEPAEPEQDEPQSTPPLPSRPAVVAQPALAAAQPQPLRRIAPAVALVVLVAVGAALWRYALPRAGAALSAAETAVPELAGAAQLSPAPAIAAPLPERGAEVFAKCDICHEVGEGAQTSVGPVLNGVVGRKAGSDPRYTYSAANKHSGITWDEATLKEYLKNPRAKVPGTKMLFPGLQDDQDISSVIAYLKQFGPDGKPPATTSTPSRAVVELPVAETAVPELAAVVQLSSAPAIVARPPEAGRSTSSRQSLQPQPPAETSAAGSTAPVSPSATGELAALGAPAAPSLGDAGHYWVQYGLFVGTASARRLQHALADRGLASLIVETRTSDKRTLLSVRSMALVNYGEASKVARRARCALGIGPLIHRSADEPARAPSVLRSTSPSTSTARGPERYWVQFGAFLSPELAQHVKKVLGESDIETAVATVRVASGQLFFVVRSAPLPDRDSALALGHLGQRAAKVDFLLRRVEPNQADVMLPSRLATNDR